MPPSHRAALKRLRGRKILLTNSCIFDCHYCINRKSSNVRRARFTAREVVDLTLLIGVINTWNRIAVGFRVVHLNDTKGAAREAA